MYVFCIIIRKFGHLKIVLDREGVRFVTKETRPEEFQIMNCYPVQSEETKRNFAHEIDRLIAETSLAKASNRYGGRSVAIACF